MSGVRKRLLFRYLPMALALAGMGYLFGEAFLFLQRMYGGVANAQNRQVLWRTPLTMTALGMILMLAMEALAYALRRKSPTLPADAAHPSPKETAS